MTDPTDPPRRRLYRARDESIWALIRQRYLSGETQKTLALAYDVPICTIQKRITREGWSKRAAIGIRPTFGGMAAPRDFQITPPQARWPEAYAPAALDAARPLEPDPRFGSWPDVGPELEPAATPQTLPGETWTSLKDPPPPSMRGGPWPKPGPWRRQLGDGSPPGYGPMPPHLAPPVQRPPSDEGAPPVTPAEVADQAVAAAGRAIAEGRYAEAERLGKLAETMRRQVGSGAVAKAAPQPSSFEADEDGWEDDQAPANERRLNCTIKTCALHTIHEQAGAVAMRLMNLARAPEQQDLAAWADMADAMGGVRDPELAAVLAAYRAEGVAGLPRHLTAVFGPPGDVPPVTFPSVFRGR